MTNLFNILLIIFAAAYTVEILFLRAGIRRASRVRKRSDNYEPTVSIIVAARNEEENIAACLQSLAYVDYPTEKIEIIAVNDYSTDGTTEVIRSIIAGRNHMRMLSTGKENGNLRGKTNAVASGIEATTGEIIMFTDADCRVNPDWVRQTVKYFSEETGILGGFTLLQSDDAFGGMQAIDWIVLFGTASATAGWNIPLTAIGNNLSVRRSAYDQTGGFKNIPFSVTEDYALVQAILTKTQYSIRFPLDTRTSVKSNPCTSWSQLYRQKQRWGVGGLDLVPRGFFIIALGWVFKLALLAGILFASPATLFAALFAKCVLDALFVSKPLKELGAISYLKYFLIFEVYYILYVVVLPIIALLNRRVVWKERSL